MDKQVGGIRITQRLATMGGGYHSSRLGPEGGGGVMGVQETTGACAVGAENLEKMEMLWSYLVK